RQGPGGRTAARAVAGGVGGSHGRADAAVRQPARRHPARLRLRTHRIDRKERIRCRIARARAAPHRAGTRARAGSSKTPPPSKKERKMPTKEEILDSIAGM